MLNDIVLNQGKPVLRYKDLTEEQKSKICNGCGGKGGWFNPPEFLFSASCNQHDFYYWRGGTKEDRHWADHEFFKKMKEDASSSKKFFHKGFHYVMALTYYLAVRFFGRKYFSYGEIKKVEDLKDL